MMTSVKPGWLSKILFVLLVSGIANIALADKGSKGSMKGNLEFRYLMGQSDQEVTGVPLCEMGMCPDKAAEVGGGTVEMEGVGTLKVRAKDGKPIGINGGGVFTLYDSDNVIQASGSWKAKKLLMFDSYGGSDAGPPANFRAGRMVTQIELKPHGEKKIVGIVELGCRIPGNPGIPGTIEGIRLYLDNGAAYLMAFDPRSTLFVDLN